MPAPSAGPNDVTTDAIGHADTTTTDGESVTADGDPAFCDPVPHRLRARQRADALVLLAESFLAGTRTDGTPRRARPLLLVGCELSDLVGDVSSRTARLLTAIHGANPAVTQEALSSAGLRRGPAVGDQRPRPDRRRVCPHRHHPRTGPCCGRGTGSGLPVPGLSDAHPVHRLPPRHRTRRRRPHHRLQPGGPVQTASHRRHRRPLEAHHDRRRDRHRPTRPTTRHLRPTRRHPVPRAAPPATRTPTTGTGPAPLEPTRPTDGHRPSRLTRHASQLTPDPAPPQTADHGQPSSRHPCPTAGRRAR
jgi:hypothetical protein